MSENVRSVQNYVRIYNVVLGFLQVIGMICIFPFLLMDPELGSDGAIFVIMCTAVFVIPFLIFFFYLAAAVQSRSKFVYYANFVSLALGVSSILTIVPAILLIIKWAEPEVRDYYLNPQA